MAKPPQRREELGFHSWDFGNGRHGAWQRIGKTVKGSKYQMKQSRDRRRTKEVHVIIIY